MEIAAIYEIFKQHPHVTTDSRNCPAGSIFWALRGESFNGNAFASQALKAGCAYAVVDEEEYADPHDSRYILVDNTLLALQELAHYHRCQFDIPVLQITGTNGKTTTKELIAAVLSEKYEVLYTQGNFNNHIGVPKTLLRLEKKHQIAVIETGANHPGEIAALAKIVDPDYGIITNVGKAHLEGFGSFEGVIHTKGELYDYLRQKDGLVFMHQDNPYLQGIGKDLRKVYYGRTDHETNSVTGRLLACAPFLNFEWKTAGGEWHVVQTHLVGGYNLDNMLAAAAIGLYFGVHPDQIDHALTHYIPSNNRSQLSETAKNHLIIDAYNANPTSMHAALENFEEMQVPHKMVILGAMKELGDSSREEHLRVVEFLKKAHFEHVWLVGSEYAEVTQDFPVFKDVDAVKDKLAQTDIRDFYILIKGSNSTHLYLLPDCL